MRSRLEDPARLEDSATVNEPLNRPVAGHCGGTEGDRGVTGVYAGRDLVAVAGPGGHDLELSAAAPRRRLTPLPPSPRCGEGARGRGSTVLLRPFHVLRRPHDHPSLMPVAVLLRRRTRQEPLVEIRAATRRPQAGQRANPHLRRASSTGTRELIRRIAARRYEH